MNKFKTFALLSASMAEVDNAVTAFKNNQITVTEALYAHKKFVAGWEKAETKLGRKIPQDEIDAYLMTLYSNYRRQFYCNRI